jgi:lipopolysaccharide biosynthesis glycosyltransferase
VTNDSTTAVVLAANDSYALPLAVTGRSLQENTSELSRLAWYVLDLGLSKQSRDLIVESWPDVPKVEFLALEADALLGLPRSSAGGYSFPTLVFGYLFVPGMLMGRHDRIVYLDSDLLVVRDVAPLLDLPLAGHAFGAAVDWQFHDVEMQSATRIYGRDKELNSGVLLIDSRRWLEEGITEEAIEFARRHDNLVLPDQDSLNAVAQGRWHEIGYEWNWQVARTVIRDYRGPLPRILHFGGLRKPWLGRSARPHYLHLYRAYARRTPFEVSAIDEADYPTFSEDDGL